MVESARSGHNDQHLVRYLLGLLPEDEAERLDELSVTDDDIAWRLQIAEDDLADAYVDGTLTGETLARFEAVCLSSPRWGDKLSLARQLREHRAIVESRDSTPSRVRRAMPAWKLAFAPALMVIAVGVLLFEQNALQRSAASLPAAPDARGDRLVTPAAPIASRDLPAEADALASRNVADTPSIRRAAPLVLSPQTRAIGQIAVLDVPHDVPEALFELRLESNDFSRYRVTLKDPATNTEVWRSGWIAATGVKDAPSVSLSVPVNLLKPQHYSLEVTGRRADGAPELVTSYTFQRLPR